MTCERCAILTAAIEQALEDMEIAGHLAVCVATQQHLIDALASAPAAPAETKPVEGGDLIRPIGRATLNEFNPFAELQYTAPAAPAKKPPMITEQDALAALSKARLKGGGA